MKRITIYFLPIILATAIFSCKKNNTAAPPKDFLGTARAFFESGSGGGTGQSPYRAADGLYGIAQLPDRSPIWAKASIAVISGRKVAVVPMRFDSLFYVSSTLSNDRLFLISDVQRLIIYSDTAGSLRAEVVTIVPDDAFFSAKGKKFTGILHVDTWSGAPLHGYLLNGEGARDIELQSGEAGVSSGRADNGMADESLTVVQTCYYFEGYNYAPAFDAEGYYYTGSLGCVTQFVASSEEPGGDGLWPTGYAGAVTGASDGAGGAGAPISPVIEKPITSGNNIIGNVADYDKCFTNVAGSANTYTVTICVDQPVPGTRDPWGFSVTGSSSGSSIVNVGHTFLIFSETNGGSDVQRNIGFYPADYVTPVSPTDNGQMNNDNSHAYNVSLTVTLTNSQFFNMLDFVASVKNSMYDLNINNCTTFALHTLQAGDVDIETSPGTWAGGGGYDPGDLGEDLRAMPLQQGMSKTTSGSSSHPNLGTCN